MTRRRTFAEILIALRAVHGVTLIPMIMISLRRNTAAFHFVTTKVHFTHSYAVNHDFTVNTYITLVVLPPDCLVYSKNASVYSILTNLNNTIGNITIWIKLWNPADEEIVR